MSQADEESHNASQILLAHLLNYASETNQSPASVQVPEGTSGAHLEQPAASSHPSHTTPNQQLQVAPLQSTTRLVPIPPASSAPSVQPQRSTPMSTAANPSTPYLAVSGVQPYGQPVGPAPHYSTGGSYQNGRFISYNPPGVVSSPSSLSQVGSSTGARPAILASPVKKPRAKKQPKTSATISDESSDTSATLPPALGEEAAMVDTGIPETPSENNVLSVSEGKIAKEKEAILVHYTTSHVRCFNLDTFVLLIAFRKGTRLALAVFPTAGSVARQRTNG